MVRLPLFQSSASRPDSPGLQFRRALRRVPRASRLFPAGLDVIDQPVENVAHRRLPGFESEIAGQHAAVHDAAQAGHVREFFRVRPDGDVAGARADDFDQRARRDAGADGAEVRVKRADRDGNARRQTGLLRPRRRQAADGAVNRMNARRAAARAVRRAWDRAAKEIPRRDNRPIWRSTSPCGRRRKRPR